jgi:PKD repeat protein
MRLKSVTLIVLLWYFLPLFSMADDPLVVDPCHYSTEGKDFWFGFMQNRTIYPEHYLEITVTSRIGAEITVTYGPGETLINKYTVGPNSSIPIPIDFNMLESKGSETIESKGIHLVSTNPVNVYALNYRKQSSDVAVIYPTEALGTEYFAMCYSPRYTSGSESNSEFLVVASEDNTTVKITPSRVTDQGKMANLPFTVILNKGQSYQVQAGNTDPSGLEDLTGSYVTADKPIAFFSGAKAVTIPVTGFVGASYDHLFEQMPPTNTWGKEFYVVPLKSRIKDTYRVLAAEDGTVVKIDGINVVVTLNRGKYYEFELSSNQASRIMSSRKVLLAQYCRSQRADANSGVGDPFMIIISPITQKINDVTFVAYESTKIKNIFFVNVIALTSEIGKMILDDVNISSSFLPFPNNEYSYAQISTTKGTHRLLNTDPKAGFLAFVYGFGDSGDTESYGYGVGFNLNIELDIVGNWTTFTPVVCQGKQIKLSVENTFDSYLWSTGETGPSIMASAEKLYWVKGTTSRGCVKYDSLFLKVSDPQMDLGKDVSSCGPGKIVLQASSGFKSYKWQDGSTGDKFKADKTGDYIVTGINEFDCDVSDTVHVDVFQVPEVKIVGDTLHCGVFTSELKVEVANADESLWNSSGAATWTCIPAGIVFTNAGPKGVTIHAPATGYYTISYKLTTKNGCTDSDSIKVGFFDIPESTFEVYDSESTDKCSSYERVVKYTGKSGATAKFNWDFGGLVLLSQPSPNIYMVSMGANVENRIIKLIVEEHGCTSIETVKSIGVKPTFTFGADKVHGCDAMCVQFKSEVTIMDKVAYQWTFGDGGVSDLANPIHCYKDTGKYDVSLMLTNVIDGCRNGSVEPKMIQIFPTPKAVISADPEFCYEDTAHFEYMNKKDYSKCKWFSKGNQILSNENSKASYLLTKEISEVGFIVEENGCSCDTLKVLVKRRPNFDFEASETEICQPFPVVLRSIPKDPNLQFKWSVDSLSQVAGDSLNHLFLKEGYYAVTLEAFSALTGCSDILTKKNFIHIYPLPVPKFDQNYKVATLEHPDISFSNLSEGAVKYFWDFGDGASSEELSPEHKYAKIGEYQVVLQVYSDFGCTDTISSKVKIIPFTFFVPNAFRPDSDIPENQIFLPIREGIDPEKYKFEIFNRIGSTVFITRNPENGWTGNMTNNSKAEPGIYVWIVQYSDIQGYEHLQKGTVMLVR